jgi:cellulose synthase/poly-beta-1,6-N-acetylglucosamine synthase-like glycosyltransferase
VPVDANGPGLRELRRSPSTNPVYKEPPRSAPEARVAKPVSHPERDTFTIRPEVRGKFIFAGEKKVFVRGVTYGPFVPREDGSLYHDPATVAADFAAIARLGANAVRTYTVPPRWLLDVAFEYRLRVMVGFGWEQHITFLDERKRRKAIEEKVREGVRQCAGHPAVLSYTIGNEIPSPIVRWYGPDRVERFLTRLYNAVKDKDPGALVSYVNYPTTEYLQPPGDFVCFNVFLESEPQLEAYLRRLHNLSGERPLVLAEIGLDSIRNGEDAQASSLAWQIRSAFAAGCAGVFTFSWTDEWHRGGAEIFDWGFGLTDRERRPKRALSAVGKAFAEAPFGDSVAWPKISVVVCTRNGSRTIAQCCEGLAKLDYPDFEVIVVDDGSTDNTADIVAGYAVRLIRTRNHGLSSARNTGANAATGEIVAYIDDDAWPDAHWLRYLALAFASGDYAGVGGPNIAPPTGSGTADAVANSPGGPIHVLLTDDVAEHIPGCNMAFRKSSLRAVGGFDASFRVAGDDVDLCWRIQAKGWTLGFTPAAMVWHHRRSSMKAYLRQQWGYGKAEAMLERKWPEKYNAIGHLSWAGRIYADHLTQLFTPRRRRVYHGTWGSALFQSVYEAVPGTLASLVTMPEWYLIIASLALVSALGTLWSPLLLAVPLFVVALGASVMQAIKGASRATFPTPVTSWSAKASRYALTALLHFLQPMARLHGRLQWGLSPWRHGVAGAVVPKMRVESVWSEQWKEPAAWLSDLESELRRRGVLVFRGGDFDRWDLQLRRGMFASTRLMLAIEEHGGGRQLARVKMWPRFSRAAGVIAGIAALLAAIAAFEHEYVTAVALAGVFGVIGLRAVQECASSMRAVSDSLQQGDPEPQSAKDNRVLQPSRASA